MPFTLTPVSSIDLNNKIINTFAPFDANSAMIGVVNDGLLYSSDLAGSALVQVSGYVGTTLQEDAVCIEGNYIFSYDNQGNLKSRNINDLQTVIDVKNYFGEDAYGVYVKNGFVYIASNNLMRIFSHVNGVMTLQNTVTIATNNFFKYVKMFGNFFYCLNNGEFRIYSIADSPTNLVLKAELLSGGGMGDAAVNGNYLYLLSPNASSVIVRDITSILNDTGSFPLGDSGFPVVNTISVSNASKITINGDKLFVSEAGLVHAFDIANPLSINDLQTVDTNYTNITLLETLNNRLYVGVQNPNNRLNTFTFNFTPTAPSIQTPPNPLTVNNGESALFSVIALGTVPLSYQWKKNGVNISDATSASYNIPVVSASDAGNYSVLISNSVGNITSTPVSLTVKTLPEIESQPENNTQDVGSPVTFSVDAVGGIPLSYQWKKNGVNILGANSNSYTIHSVIATDAGIYTVIVANSFGSIVSNDVTLTVNTPPGSLLTINNNIPNNGNNFSTVVIGNKAFLMGDVTGLTMLDITDPSSPVVLDSKFYSPGGPSWMMVAIGNVLYLTWGNRLLSVDTNGIGSTLPSSPTDQISGTYKWLATDGTSLFAGTDVGSKIVHRFDPSNSGIIGSPIWAASVGSSVMGAGAVHGNFVVTITSSDIFCIDKTTGTVLSNKSGSFGSGTPIPDIEIYNNNIYAIKDPTFSPVGIAIYPINNSGIIGSSISSGTYGSGMSNDVYTLTRKNNFLYASDSSGKMFVFDITNPQSPIFFASSATFPEKFRKPAINNSQKLFATTFSNPSRFVVLGFDTAPVISSTAPITGSVGVLYSYQPTVVDNEGNVSNWSLINAPSGMTVNPSSGLIQWTPGSGVLTSGTFYLKVTDTSGLIDVETITVYVAQGIVFTPGTPVTSDPTPSGNTLTIPGNCYTYPATFQFTELPLDRRDEAIIKFLDYGFKITTTGSTTFDHSITLTIHYTDAQLIAAGVTEENKLKVVFFDTNTNKWVNLKTTINKNNNTATAQLPHLTDFGFGESSIGSAAKVSTNINNKVVTVLTYLRDTGEPDSKLYYVFVDENNNLQISQTPVHSQDCQCDIIGNDSVIE